jgi:hypothetical protein
VIDPTGGSAPRPAGGAVGASTPRLASLDRGYGAAAAWQCAVQARMSAALDPLG